MPIKAFIGLIFPFMLILGSLNAKKPEPAKLLLHLNKHIFVSGSQIKYAVYLPTTDVTSVKTIYFELGGATNLQKIQWKSQTSSNLLAGEFPIPDSLKSGLYFLQVYTNQRHSTQGKHLAVSPIIIQEIHTEPLSQLTVLVPDADTFAINPFLFENLKAKTSVNLDLRVDSLADKHSKILHVAVPREIESARLSVSVTEITPFDSLLKTQQLYPFNCPVTPDYENVEPERNATIFSGKVTDSLLQPLANAMIYISSEAPTSFFIFGKTDTHGNFCFSLDTSWNNKELFVQLTNNPGGIVPLRWFIDDKGLLPVKTDTGVYRLNSQQFTFLNQLQKRELVHRIFYPDSLSSSVQQKKIVPENIFFQPKYVIYPADYEYLSSFKELADNILTAVRFKTTQQEFKMGIVNNNQVYYDKVLVFLNGIPVSNLQILANLTSKDIERVEVFNSDLLYGDLTFHGVVAVFTHAKKYRPHDVFEKSIVYNHSFHSQRYFYPEKDESKPTLLPDIFWNPMVQVSYAEPLIIPLKNVDVGHTYQLEIHGITQKGDFIFFSKPINF